MRHIISQHKQICYVRVQGINSVHSPVCVCVIVHNCHTQHSTEKFVSDSASTDRSVHLQIILTYLITFRVSRRQREMYCGHAHLCVSVCVCLSTAACLHYCTDPDVTRGTGRGCPLFVHYWADLQSVHGLHCYGNTKNAWQSPALISQAHRMHYARTHARACCVRDVICKEDSISSIIQCLRPSVL